MMKTIHKCTVVMHCFLRLAPTINLGFCDLIWPGIFKSQVGSEKIR